MRQTGIVVNKAWTEDESWFPHGTWYFASVSYKRKTLRLPVKVA